MRRRTYPMILIAALAIGACGGSPEEDVDEAAADGERQASTLQHQACGSTDVGWYCEFYFTAPVICQANTQCKNFQWIKKNEARSLHVDIPKQSNLPKDVKWNTMEFVFIAPTGNCIATRYTLYGETSHQPPESIQIASGEMPTSKFPDKRIHGRYALNDFSPIGFNLAIDDSEDKCYGQPVAVVINLFAKKSQQ